MFLSIYFVCYISLYKILNVIKYFVVYLLFHLSCECCLAPLLNSNFLFSSLPLSYILFNPLDAKRFPKDLPI